MVFHPSMVGGSSGIHCARKPQVIRAIPSVKNHLEYTTHSKTYHLFLSGGFWHHQELYNKTMHPLRIVRYFLFGTSVITFLAMVVQARWLYALIWALLSAMWMPLTDDFLKSRFNFSIPGEIKAVITVIAVFLVVWVFL